MKNNFNSFTDHCIVSFSTDIENMRVIIMITDTLPPYTERKVTCEGVIVFRFNCTENSDSPYFCEEFYWNNCENNLRKVLNDIQYPFFSGLPITPDNILIPQNNFYHLYFEGDACGDIICKTIFVDENF
jgi:hypothetical protein